MKNAGKHADELKSLIKRLIKEHKPGDRAPQEPLKALVRGAMSYDMPDARAEEAMRAIDREFVDSTAIRTELGWAPKWTLEDGLRATYDWYAGHLAAEAVA